MNGCEGYRALARFYDTLNAEIDYAAWADFMESCFARHLPKRPELILDLACGTGSMTVQLAARGYDMIGIDGSADMLSAAYARSVGKNILYLQQDLREFELYGTVGAVTCCLDSLNYLLGDGELQKCFSLVHNYLDPDGLFLFDMNTPHKFQTVYGSNAYLFEETLPGEEFPPDEDDPTAPLPDPLPPATVFCAWQNDYHSDTRICDFELSLFEEQPDGSYLRADEHQQERCYSMEEITAALEAAHLELLGVYADLNFSAPTPDTERWYFLARAVKPNT